MISSRSLFFAGIALALLLVLDSRAVGPVISPRSESVTNTGDATAADVAVGKTFSSASLTNATGTNTANATVPRDMPIQPFQAYVDNIQKLQVDLENATGNSLNLSNQGINLINPQAGFPLDRWFFVAGNYIGAPTLDLSGNNLDSFTISSVVALLALKHASYENAGGPGTIILTGANMGACTGQCGIDKSNLEDAGWTVLTN